MTSKPAILLIPGSFSHAGMYYPLQDAIQAQGYECFVNNAPSASRNPPEEPATLEDDAVFFRGLIEKLADQGKDVVVVAHSYGGIIATEAAKGAAKADRQASGKQGGIVKIVYLSAIVLPEGGSNLKDYGEPPEALVSIGEVRTTLDGRRPGCSYGTTDLVRKAEANLNSP
jgi:pimeloyl-ACP methyl ester carboxylesterase